MAFNPNTITAPENLSVIHPFLPRQIVPFQQAFGAACDGVTDDTSAWQAMMTYWRSNPGTKFTFPAGKTSLCSQTLILSNTSNAAVTGELAMDTEALAANGAGRFAIKFTNNASSYPASGTNPTAYNCGFYGSATNSGSPEGTGVDGIKISIDIIPPARGVGIFISQGRNIDFSGMRILAANAAGSCPQYGLWLDKCEAVIGDKFTTLTVTGSGVGYHRFHVFLNPNTSVDSDTNQFNDNIDFSDWQFGGNALACIGDWGSTSEGLRTIKNIVQSGTVGYGYIGGYSSVELANSQFENATQVVGSTIPSPSSTDIPVGSISGVDTSCPWTDVVPTGNTFGERLYAHDNYIAFATVGFDVSGYQSSAIQGNVTSGADMTTFVQTFNPVGQHIVEPPIQEGSLNSGFIVALAPYGNIAQRGSYGPTWGQSESCWREDQIVNFNATAWGLASYAIVAKETRQVVLLSATNADYPVIAINGQFNGNINIDLVYAGNADNAHGFPNAHEVDEVNFQTNTTSPGQMSIPSGGTYEVLKKQFAGTEYTLPSGTGVYVGYIMNTGSAPLPVVYIGIKYPKLDSGAISTAIVTLTIRGGFSTNLSQTGEAAQNACYNSVNITDYTTAAAAITAAGAAGVAFAEI